VVFRTKETVIILNMEGCMIRTEQQLGNWKPSNNFLVDRGKQKTCVEMAVVEYCG